MALLQMLADLYPSQSSTIAVWERAGGRAYQVEERSRPLDRWQALWNQSRNGAVVTPAALLYACWEEFPNNKQLLQAVADELPNHTHPDLTRAADQLVTRLPTQGGGDAGLIELLEEWEETDPARTFAAICPAVERRLVPAQRVALKERLKTPVLQGLVNGAVQAGMGQAVKVALDTLIAVS